MTSCHKYLKTHYYGPTGSNFSHQCQKPRQFMSITSTCGLHWWGRLRFISDHSTSANYSQSLLKNAKHIWWTARLKHVYIAPATIVVSVRWIRGLILSPRIIASLNFEHSTGTVPKFQFLQLRFTLSFYFDCWRLSTMFYVPRASAGVPPVEEVLFCINYRPVLTLL